MVFCIWKPYFAVQKCNVVLIHSNPSNYCNRWHAQLEKYYSWSLKRFDICISGPFIRTWKDARQSFMLALLLEARMPGFLQASGLVALSIVPSSHSTSSSFSSLLLRILSSLPQQLVQGSGVEQWRWLVKHRWPQWQRQPDSIQTSNFSQSGYHGDSASSSSSATGDS